MVFSEKVKKSVIMGGIDVDRDGYVTGIDLFLLLGLWFSASLILLLCYACFDVCDRMQRKEDLRHRSEKEMLVEPKDTFEGLDEEDTDTDSLEGVDIDCNGDCVHYTADMPIIKDLA